MRTKELNQLELQFQDWIEKAIRERISADAGKAVSPMLKVDENSEANFMVVLNPFRPDEAFLSVTSEWLRAYAPNWTVTFVLCFQEDAVVVDASTIWLPAGAESIGLSAYLRLQQERSELRSWVRDNFPPEQWGNSSQFNDRLEELKRLRASGSAPVSVKGGIHHNQPTPTPPRPRTPIPIRPIAERLTKPPPVQARFRAWVAEWVQLRLDEYHPKSPGMIAEADSDEPTLLRAWCPEIAPGKELLVDVQNWLRVNAPDWTVIFTTIFPEDILRISATGIGVPEHAEGRDLDEYLVELARLRRRMDWEAVYLPPEDWSINRDQALDRLSG